jgi:hypothetical protein
MAFSGVFNFALPVEVSILLVINPEFDVPRFVIGPAIVRGVFTAFRTFFRYIHFSNSFDAVGVSPMLRLVRSLANAMYRF